MDWRILSITAVILLGMSYFYFANKRARQLAYIKSYAFHRSIREKITKKYPHLTNEQIHLIFRALRDYFYLCHRAKRKMVAMPSHIVDDAWHEFILFTRSYKKFCQHALGRFLHHTPSEAMTTPTLAQAGIKRAWRLACAKEKINPDTPERLPLIFAIDAMLDIPNGFTYTLNCQNSSSPNDQQGYCASHINCAAGCAGESAHHNNSSDGSDCGGGCGGD